MLSYMVLGFFLIMAICFGLVALLSLKDDNFLPIQERDRLNVVIALLIGCLLWPLALPALLICYTVTSNNLWD